MAKVYCKSVVFPPPSPLLPPSPTHTHQVARHSRHRHRLPHHHLRRHMHSTLHMLRRRVRMLLLPLLHLLLQWRR